MIRKVVEDLVKNREVNITSRYESLERNNVVGDFQVVVMEKYLSQDNELSFFERVIMKLYFWLKEASLSEERGFGLDPSNVLIEKFPLIVSPLPDLSLKRIGRTNWKPEIGRCKFIFKPNSYTLTLLYSYTCCMSAVKLCNRLCGIK
jgi:hypothetical protein